MQPTAGLIKKVGGCNPHRLWSKTYGGCNLYQVNDCSTLIALQCLHSIDYITCIALQ
jgi:hypothetical protein